MTDEAALLAAILADREEDTPRLAYADWLQENGQPERAEFICVQVELARLAGVSIEESPVNTEHREIDIAKSKLRRRERELLDAHGFDWCEIGNGWKVDGREKYGNVVTVRYYAVPGSYGRCVFAFIRGFAGQVECPWVCWHTHADAILARQPIERVRLTTRPTVIETRYPWELRSEFRLKPGGVPCSVSRREIANSSINLLPLIAEQLLQQEWPRIEFELPCNVNGIDYQVAEEAGRRVAEEIERRVLEGLR